MAIRDAAWPSAPHIHSINDSTQLAHETLKAPSPPSTPATAQGSPPSRGPLQSPLRPSLSSCPKEPLAGITMPSVSTSSPPTTGLAVGFGPQHCTVTGLYFPVTKSETWARRPFSFWTLCDIWHRWALPLAAGSRHCAVSCLSSPFPSCSCDSGAGLDLLARPHQLPAWSYPRVDGSQIRISAQTSPSNSTLVCRCRAPVAHYRSSAHACRCAPAFPDGQRRAGLCARPRERCVPGLTGHLRKRCGLRKGRPPLAGAPSEGTAGKLACGLCPHRQLKKPAFSSVRFAGLGTHIARREHTAHLAAQG